MDNISKNYNSELVIFPVEHLQTIENQRQALYDLAEKYNIPPQEIMEVSQPLWGIANLKHPEYPLPFNEAVNLLCEHDGKRFEAVQQITSQMKLRDLRLITDHCLSLERSK